MAVGFEVYEIRPRKNTVLGPSSSKSQCYSILEWCQLAWPWRPGWPYNAAVEEPSANGKLCAWMLFKRFPSSYFFPASWNYRIRWPDWKFWNSNIQTSQIVFTPPTPHCPKCVVQTNFPSIAKTHIFGTRNMCTFTWTMPYKSIPVLIIT